ATESRTNRATNQPAVSIWAAQAILVLLQTLLKSWCGDASSGAVARNEWGGLLAGKFKIGVSDSESFETRVVSL
ncbi:hypothetical protein K438DRAFT_2018718, partial [Mycena galopus ATCC 62051]